MLKYSLWHVNKYIKHGNEEVKWGCKPSKLITLEVVGKRHFNIHLFYCFFYQWALWKYIYKCSFLMLQNNIKYMRYKDFIRLTLKIINILNMGEKLEHSMLVVWRRYYRNSRGWTDCRNVRLHTYTCSTQIKCSAPHGSLCWDNCDQKNPTVLTGCPWWSMATWILPAQHLEDCLYLCLKFEVNSKLPHTKYAFQNIHLTISPNPLISTMLNIRHQDLL